MNIINKTPHPIHVLAGDKVATTFPACPHEELIRLKAESVPDEPVCGVPTSRTAFGEATNLPTYANDVFYIVSQLVKGALPARSDLLVPAEVVRDDDGNIVGCRSLGR